MCNCFEGTLLEDLVTKSILHEDDNEIEVYVVISKNNRVSYICIINDTYIKTMENFYYQYFVYIQFHDIISI